jgi:hypothetical protein
MTIVCRLPDFCTLPTDYWPVHVFHILTVNNDYFLNGIKHLIFVAHKRHMLCEVGS